MKKHLLKITKSIKTVLLLAIIITCISSINTMHVSAKTIVYSGAYPPREYITPDVKRDQQGVIYRAKLTSNKITIIGNISRYVMGDRSDKIKQYKNKKLTFKLAKNVKYYYIDESYHRVSKKKFMNGLKHPVGLGLFVRVRNGKVIRLSFNS